MSNASEKLTARMMTNGLIPKMAAILCRRRESAADVEEDPGCKLISWVQVRWWRMDRRIDTIAHYTSWNLCHWWKIRVSPLSWNNWCIQWLIPQDCQRISKPWETMLECSMCPLLYDAVCRECWTFSIPRYNNIKLFLLSTDHAKESSTKYSWDSACFAITASKT